MIVIGCGKAKLPHPAPAGELYTGSLFVAARKYAEYRQKLSGEPWAILSGKHGLVTPEAMLDPYEERLMLKGEALKVWAIRAAARCLATLRLTGEPVECLMGHPYAEPFRAELDAFAIPSSEPLRGKGLGMRLQWLSLAVRA